MLLPSFLYTNENMPIPARCRLQYGIGHFGHFVLETPPEDKIRFLLPAPRRLNRPARTIGDWCLIHWLWTSMCLGIPPPYRVAVMVNTALSTRVCPLLCASRTACWVLPLAVLLHIWM